MSENAVREEFRPAVLDFTGQVVVGLPTGGAINSINGDATPAQLLTGVIPSGQTDSTMDIVDNGVGGHSFEPRTLSVTSAASVTVPADNTRTVATTLTVPCAGLWHFIGNVRTTVVAISAQSTCRLLNGLASIGESAHDLGGTAQGDGHSVISYLLQLTGGEIISLEITMHNGGPTPIDYDTVLNGVRLGVI